MEVFFQRATIEVPKVVANQQEMVIFLKWKDGETAIRFNLKNHLESKKASKVIVYSKAQWYGKMQGKKIYLALVRGSVWAIGDARGEKFFLLKGSHTVDFKKDELIELSERLNSI